MNMTHNNYLTQKTRKQEFVIDTKERTINWKTGTKKFGGQIKTNVSQ
jgi:hypothetical protein